MLLFNLGISKKTATTSFVVKPKIAAVVNDLKTKTGKTSF